MQFYQPDSVREALEMADPENSFLAGGTDLVLQMREGKTKPKALIDLGRIKELKQVVESEGWLDIGSMVTFESLRKSALVESKAKALWLASETMGSPQIRNQATLGGNLGNNSPAADGLPPLLALGALVRVVSKDNEECLPLGQVVADGLAKDKLILGFRIPLQGYQSGFAKLGRRKALAIARLSIAIAVRTEGDWVRDLKVAFGAVGRNAFLAESLAESLSNQKNDSYWQEQLAVRAQELVAQTLGSRPSAPYKRVAVGGVVRQALETLGLEGVQE